MADEFTGLIPEPPDVVARRLSRQIALPVRAGEIVVPETLFEEPPAWFRVENQSQTNTCASNAMTSVAEVIWFLATGELLQFSRLHNYEKASGYCGIRGDQGRTLSSVLEAGTRDGFCLEDLMPFTVPVTTRIPAGADDDAAKRRITHTMDVSAGYDAVRTVIGQNMGGVLNATWWPIEYVNGYRVEHYKPTGNGGHARGWLFLSKRLDSRGRPWVWCANSHSKMAQHNGFEEWSPDSVDECIRDDTWGITGVTAMTTPAPQEVDWTGPMNPFAR